MAGMKILLLCIIAILPSIEGDKFLILHPFYSGSHVLTLHHVAKALVDRGHKARLKLYIYLASFHQNTYRQNTDGESDLEHELVKNGQIQ